MLHVGNGAFLRAVKDRAERGDLAWLAQKGKVYAAVVPV